MPLSILNEKNTMHERGLTIEKGIRIEYSYNFGLPLGNSAFVRIWLEFDLLVRTIVKTQKV